MIYVFLVGVAAVAFFSSLDSQKPYAQGPDEKEAYDRIYKYRNHLIERW